MNPEDDSWNHCPFSPWELINCQNKQKNTALHLAVENQSMQVAQFLIENGANIVMRLLLSAFSRWWKFGVVFQFYFIYAGTATV